MNIKEYYSLVAKVYFNQVIIISIYTTICLFILFSLGITINIVLLCGLICIILIYFFFKYHYYVYRHSKASFLLNSQEKFIHDNKRFLVMYVPARNIQIRLFKSNGLCEWEISEKRIPKLKTFFQTTSIYQIKKRDGSILATFKLDSSNKIAAGLSYNKERLILTHNNREKNKHSFSVNKIEYSIVKKSSAIEFNKENKVIARIERGIMPINWQKQFSPNTPIIEFIESIEEIDFYILVCLLIYFFRNYYY
ncbi:hypothetical protein ACQKP0_06565 [Heyndrickxia sp. NPDC080065]|uniref:hypothetical protein n=1 Tax=Heyndrickxia sp. NPDC080065 TaxID=3390568 RepID=UPI003D044EC5